MSTLRAGLVGLGMIGRHHARVLSQLEGVDLVAVADPRGDLHGAAGGTEVLHEVEELLALGIDYCVVAAPTAAHEEVGLQLAAAGVHALIEKPLAPESEAAQRLAKAFADAGLIGAVGHIERYNAALQSARRRMEQGELGEILQVATRRQGPFPGRIADVGVVLDLASHDIDLTAWITQEQYTRISARTVSRSGRPHEDMVAAVADLHAGTVASHLVNWLSPFKERVTTITGERGVLVADTLTADLTFYANGSVETTWQDVQQFRGVSEGDVIRYAIEKPEPLLVEHRAFRDAVLGQPADIVSLEQAVATVVVAESLLTAARTGSTITIGSEE